MHHTAPPPLLSTMPASLFQAHKPSKLNVKLLSDCNSPYTCVLVCYQVEMLQQLELQAAALLLRLEELRRVVTSTGCQFRAFCSWLLKSIQQLDDSQEANNNGEQADRGSDVCATHQAPNSIR